MQIFAPGGYQGAMSHIFSFLQSMPNIFRLTCLKYTDQDQDKSNKEDREDKGILITLNRS